MSIVWQPNTATKTRYSSVSGGGAGGSQSFAAYKLGVSIVLSLMGCCPVSMVYFFGVLVAEKTVCVGERLDSSP